MKNYGACCFLFLSSLYMHIIFVLFGATGDLAKRKLYSALYNIFSERKDLEIDILGVGRRVFEVQDFQDYIEKTTEYFIEKRADFQAFLQTIYYSRLEMDNEHDYVTLNENISKLQKKDSEIICYLAISPEYFGSFTRNYKNIAPKNMKIIFEKPFGTDLESARALNANIMDAFHEEQIYRIDHYIGKEAIQNVLAFRFANTLFEALWNNKYIDNIQITASESVGVGDR
jgi:glucose-6-phosphate 1-dehydrogenase